MKLDKNNIYIKRKFRIWLLKAKGFSEDTVDKVERAISLYEEFTENKDFGYFSPEVAINFKEWLKKRKHKNKPIALNTYRTYLIHLRKFFEFLLNQPGYKSRITFDSLEYLNLTKKESRISSQVTLRKFPTKEFIVDLVNAIVPSNEIEFRDKALISFTFLTGMRDSAIISLPIRAVNIDELYIVQDPKIGVKTKFSKTSYPILFRFDENLLRFFIEWYKHLIKIGFSDNDPVFPRSKCIKGNNSLSFEESTEVESIFWESTDSIRKIFKKYSQLFNKEYYPPHTFRHAAILNALKLARTGDEIKAISQNFSHEEVSTTFSIYAQYEPEKLLEVLQNLDYEVKTKITNEDIFQKLIEFQQSLTQKDD